MTCDQASARAASASHRPPDTHLTDPIGDPSTDPVPLRESARRGRLAAAWSAVTAAVGVAMGLAPHLLHHAGLFAGAALVTGARGNLLFGGLGLLLSLPLLRRLHRRYRSWKAPAVALALLAGLFTLSTLVLGPAINEARDPAPSQDAPAPTQTPEDHDQHHD